MNFNRKIEQIENGFYFTGLFLRIRLFVCLCICFIPFQSYCLGGIKADHPPFRGWDQRFSLLLEKHLLMKSKFVFSLTAFQDSMILWVNSKGFTALTPSEESTPTLVWGLKHEHRIVPATHGKVNVPSSWQNLDTSAVCETLQATSLRKKFGCNLLKELICLGFVSSERSCQSYTVWVVQLTRRLHCNNRGGNANAHCEQTHVNFNFAWDHFPTFSQCFIEICIGTAHQLMKWIPMRMHLM